ncbi:LysE family translocator, partial [Candidatus Skiveiella danica]|uniref:LysE family translocator n=1 Tax=Candidatus Skiveiella danica TaxID=3386177 RepID=UPI001D40F3CF|nr:LysE family transporter [Betaproteobacteria bacterium]
AGKRSTALAAVAGMTAGTLMWAILAVAGVGIVFTAHPAIRQLAQVAGGSICCNWLSGSGAQARLLTRPQRRRYPTRAGALRVGFITSALNPKIALFYGSVFATAFPAHPSNTLVGLAVAMVFLNSVVWHTAWPGRCRGRPCSAYLRHFRALNRGAGLLVGAIGLKLIAGTLLEFRSPGA